MARVSRSYSQQNSFITLIGMRSPMQLMHPIRVMYMSLLLVCILVYNVCTICASTMYIYYMHQCVL